MIENARHNTDRGDGNYYIIWGASTLIASIVVTTALTIWQNPLLHWLWLIIPIIGSVWQALLERKRPKGVKTHIDRATTIVWRSVLAINLAIPVAFLALYYFEVDTFINYYSLFALIPLLAMLVTNLGIIISGAIIKFRPLCIGGGVGIVLAFGTLFLWEHYTFIFALWALVAMVIPGVKLNLYARRRRDA